MSQWAQSLSYCFYNNENNLENKAKCILAHLSMPVPRSWWNITLNTGNIPSDYISILCDLRYDLLEFTKSKEKLEFAKLIALAFIDEDLREQEVKYGNIENPYSVEEYLTKAEQVLSKREDIRKIAKMISKKAESHMKKHHSRKANNNHNGDMNVPERGTSVKLTNHNVEQMARGYLMYELARRGYRVQITDSRFPTYDMLVVSPNGKHFGIEVKGQSTKNFWRFNERQPHPEMYYAFVFVPKEGNPRAFIMDSESTMKLWNDYRGNAINKGAKEDNIWGLNWTQPHPFENRYDILPN